MLAVRGLKLRSCCSCGSRTSVTAGTLFDRRRSPLTVWFTACWMFAAQKDGVSALSLQRALEMGTYQSIFKIFTTAAAMEKGLGINSILDTPQSVRLPASFGHGGCNDGSGDYCVKNYNNSYNSQYSVTQALAKSPNTAFVKLIASTGVTPTVDMAVKLGLRSYATQPAAPGG